MRTLTPPLLAACALAWGVALALGAFASPAPAPPSRTPAVVVVATTGQAADLVRQVGGDRVRVHALLDRGADPHGHEATSGDVAATAAARLVVRSGGELDAWAIDVVRAARGRAPVVDLSRSVRLVGEDPHWWLDPRNVVRAVAVLSRALGRADPAGTATYAARARAYARRVAATDRAIAACWAAVPAERRRLVTTHDSLGYYARRYGLRVVGSVLDTLSVRGQPSARALSRLVRRMRAQGVRALFGERALNARVERAVAREAGARVGRPLWGDALGPPGSSAGTLLGALTADSRTLLAGLGAECALP